MFFKAKSITKVGAGDGFSVFASDNGILMTCGDGTLGCLGKGAFSNCVDRFLDPLFVAKEKYASYTKFNSKQD